MTAVANNKVVLADGTTLIDLTEDSVTPETLAAGRTAHGKDGGQVCGTAKRVYETSVFCCDPAAKRLSFRLPFRPSAFTVKNGLFGYFTFPEEFGDEEPEAMFGSGKVYCFAFDPEPSLGLRALSDEPIVGTNVATVWTEDDESFEMHQSNYPDADAAITYADGLVTIDLSLLDRSRYSWINDALFWIPNLSDAVSRADFYHIAYAWFTEEMGYDPQNMTSEERRNTEQTALGLTLGRTYNITAWER